MRTYHFYPLKVLVLLASGVNTILVIPDGCLTVAGRLQAFVLLVAGISTFNQEGMTNTDKPCLKDFTQVPHDQNRTHTYIYTHIIPGFPVRFQGLIDCYSHSIIRLWVDTCKEFPAAAYDSCP